MRGSHNAWPSPQRMGIFPLSLICHKSGISALLLQARSWAVAVAAKIRESKNEHRGHSRLHAFTDRAHQRAIEEELRVTAIWPRPSVRVWHPSRAD